MRLHFSIGGYDYRRTTRLLQSIHVSKIQASESTTNSLSSGLRFDGAGRHLFSEGEKNAALFFSFIFNTLFGQLPRCIAGTLLLPLSPPETDPQILEHRGYADEVHLGKYIRAKDFGLEF